MCIINTSRRFVFVHVPKSAGTSICHALSPLTTAFDLEIGGTPYGEAFQELVFERFRLHKHMRASELRDLLGPARWSDSFTFAFVRNPFSRAYSTYKYLKQHRAELPFIDQFDTFDEYVSSAEWDGHGPFRLLLPQSHWTHHRGEQLVDFIGRVETFTADLDHVLRMVGAGEAKAAPDVQNVSALPPSPPRLSEQAVAKIVDRYASDFAVFGYDPTVPTFEPV